MESRRAALPEYAAPSRPTGNAVIAVAAGGAGGTLARWGVGAGAAAAGLDGHLGVGIANTLGAFFLCYLTAVVSRTTDTWLHRNTPLWATGALGSFTTYSGLATATPGVHWFLAHLVVGVAAGAAGYAAGSSRAR